MHTNRSNQGFAALQLVLLLVIAAAVVGTGWYVYSAGNKANSNLDKADDSASTKTVTTKKVSTPLTSSELSTYKSSQFGISFTYPKTWGDVAVSEYGLKAENGKKSYMMNFSATKMPYVSIAETGWTTKGIGSVCSLGVIEPTSVFKSFSSDDGLYTAKRVLKDTSQESAIERLQVDGDVNNTGDCYNVEIDGIKKLNKNPTYQVAEVVYDSHNPVFDKMSAEQAKSAYDKNPSVAIPDPIRTQVIALLDSIHEL